MKKGLLFSSLMLFSLSMFAQSPAWNGFVNICEDGKIRNKTSEDIHLPGEYVPNQIMVMVNPGFTIEGILEKLNGQGLLGQYRLHQTISKRYRIYLLEHDAILGSSGNLIYDINRMDEVALAQTNHYIQERVMPNDPSFGQQWGMHNTGGGGGTADADIDGPEAWNITTGGVTTQGDTIVVAVVDGGVQESHPDLAPNMWRNYAEIGGTPGVDDDGNGYIDDVEGWDAVGNDNNVPNNGHATHCAGIVGARGNNSTGVTGVNWNVKILNVRGSSFTESVVVLAYDYIASLREVYNNSGGTMGAFVVATSNSFGVDYGNPASYPIWCAMYDTLGTLGILSAGAGPNNEVDIDVVGDIPTTCPSNYMIAVTNTTNTDAKRNPAGYGTTHMDIGAPGTNIYSTYTTSSYNSLSGTSMATPHVAGAIGLYYAAACDQFITDYKNDPWNLAFQMRNFLLTGVDSISSMATTTSSQGRLNVHKGILRVQTYNCSGLPPSAAFTANQTAVCVGSSVQYTYTGTGSGPTYQWTFGGGSPGTSSAANPSVTYNTPGTYNVQVIVTDSYGADTLLMTSYITVNANPAIPTINDVGGTLYSSYTGSGNQWYDGGGIIPGATADNYTPSTSGIYYVVYTDANGCSSTSANFNAIVGIESNSNNIGISVYPNPVTSKLTIDATGMIHADIQLVDLSGRVVVRKQMNESMMRMDLSSIATGVYMLQITYDGKTITRKIVKH